MLLLYSAQGAPAPAPPAWQRDLDATLALQTALALAPPADADRSRRLGDLYHQLATRYPNQAEVQKAAGNYYGQTEDTEAALTCWLRAQQLEPGDAATADTLGLAYLQAGQAKKACAQFEQAVKAQPNVSAYHFNLANVLYLFRHEVLAPPGRPDEQAALAEALEHFRRAAELAPADLQLAKAYAETFYIFASPDWSQALAAWKTVLALSGADTDFVNGQLARVSLRLGRPAEAEMYLQQIKSPAFDAMKTKFRQQAATMDPAAAPSPAPSARPQWNSVSSSSK